MYAVWTKDIVTLTYIENGNLNRTRVVKYGKGAHVHFAHFYSDGYIDYLYNAWDSTGYEIKGYGLTESVTESDMMFDAYGYFRLSDWSKNPFGYNNSITNDIVLYAVWGPKKYSVNFLYYDENENLVTFDYQTFDYNTKIKRPEEVPLKAGFTFENWYQKIWNEYGEMLSDEPFDFSTVLNENNFNGTYIELYAKFNEGGATTGDAGINITFAESSDSDINVKVSRSGSIFCFEAEAGYSEYNWRINGSPFADGPKLEVDTASWPAGIYDVILTARKDWEVYSYYGSIEKE